MVAEVFAGLSAIKTAFDLAKGLKDIDDAARRNAAVIELQEKILAAREAQSTLLERISELEKKVASFEAWEREKQRYELQDIWRGSLAYVIKESVRGPEPSHNICANCYQRGHKRILQLRVRGIGKELFCSECNTAIFVGGVDYPRRHPRMVMAKCPLGEGSAALDFVWLLRGSHLRLFLSWPVLRSALDRSVNGALESSPRVGTKLNFIFVAIRLLWLH